MISEPSTIIYASDRDYPKLSLLRRRLIDFGRAAKRPNANEIDSCTESQADETLLQIAQIIVGEVRNEILWRLKYKVNDEQVRYFREVIKSMNLLAGDRLEIPDYESLANLTGNSEVFLRRQASPVRESLDSYGA